MITEEEFQANLGNQLNRRWGNILGQNLIKIEQLEFEINQQLVQIQKMTKNIEDLKSDLHQAQIDLIAARGKNIIDTMPE